MSDAGDFAENEIADWLGANGAPSTVTQVFLKLHIGAPGESGASNAAATTVRQEAQFNAASGGAVALTATVTWSNVANAETISHVSAWDASSGGNHLFNAALSVAQVLQVGNDFQITALTVTVA
jgi:hypothetical protein